MNIIAEKNKLINKKIPIVKLFKEYLTFYIWTLFWYILSESFKQFKSYLINSVTIFGLYDLAHRMSLSLNYLICKNIFRNIPGTRRKHFFPLDIASLSTKQRNAKLPECNFKNEIRKWSQVFRRKYLQQASCFISIWYLRRSVNTLYLA